MRVDTYPLPYPWSFGPKLCLSLARGERNTFSVQTLFASLTVTPFLRLPPSVPLPAMKENEGCEGEDQEGQNWQELSWRSRASSKPLASRLGSRSPLWYGRKEQSKAPRLAMLKFEHVASLREVHIHLVCQCLRDDAPTCGLPPRDPWLLPS